MCVWKGLQANFKLCKVDGCIICGTAWQPKALLAAAIPMAKVACMGGGDNWLNYVKESHPMGHPGTPEDISFMVNALVAEEAHFITAQTIAVDGGFGRIRL